MGAGSILGAYRKAYRAACKGHWATAMTILDLVREDFERLKNHDWGPYQDPFLKIQEALCLLAKQQLDIWRQQKTIYQKQRSYLKKIGVKREGFILYT
jgi:hypothetical protein